MIIRLYARLLRLYPRTFFDRFGSEMLDVFEQACSASNQKLLHTIAFCIREFAGLLISISQERWSERSSLMSHKLFRWYLIPVWLFGFSLIAAIILLWSERGYLVKPASTFSQIETIESVSLVKFDADYQPTPLYFDNLVDSEAVRHWSGIDYRPNTSEVFPFYQMLTWISQKQPDLELSNKVDQVLLDRVSQLLTNEGVELHIKDRPSEPVVGPSCGWWPGFQSEPDGSYLTIEPVVTFDDHGCQWTGENTRSYHFPVGSSGFYSIITPAAYLVSGQARDGTPLVFAAYVSGEICEGFGLCGMHRYHEYLLDASNNALTIRDQLTYRFDLMDGDDEEAMTMLNATGLTIVLLILYLLIAVLRHFIRFIQRYIIQPPVPHRA